jgi:hypothetical protein
VRVIAGAVVVLAGAVTFIVGTAGSQMFSGPLQLSGFAFTAIGFLMIIMDYITGGRSIR